MRRVPHAAAGAGARIAAADARDAGRRRTTSFAARAIPGTGPQVDAMDLGIGFRTASYRRLRTLYGIYPTLGATTGTNGIRRIKSAGLADFLRCHAERRGIHCRNT